MNKNLLYFTAILLMSSKSFGYVLIGEGKVSDPVITGTPGSGVVEKPLTAEQQAQIQKLSQEKKSSSLSAAVHASAHNSSGHVGEYIKVSADHSISVSNYTNQKQNYRYTYNLQCSNANSTYSQNVQLSPGASFYDTSYNYTTLQTSQPGS